MQALKQASGYLEAQSCVGAFTHCFIAVLTMRLAPSVRGRFCCFLNILCNDSGGVRIEVVEREDCLQER